MWGVFDVEVGVDDGEPGTFFDEQQVCDAVIHLVVADGDDVRGKGVHDLDGGKPLVFGINDRAPEHIARNGVDGVGLFGPHLFDVAGQHGDAAHQLFVHLLCQKIPVQVVGVEDGDFLVCFMLLFPFLHQQIHKSLGEQLFIYFLMTCALNRLISGIAS